jgi:hypothetical protein
MRLSVLGANPKTKDLYKTSNTEEKDCTATKELKSAMLMPI